MLNLSGPDPRSAQKGAWLSMAAYLVLSLLKCWTGLHIQSEAMFADGLNNVSDLLLSFAILIGLKVSQQPADHAVAGASRHRSLLSGGGAARVGNVAADAGRTDSGADAR